ncbi:MAG: hypothetical protein ABJM06_00345 [Gilvibacter sp.]
MAPLKFEENIKDSLAKRSIEPSAGSWNKLSAKLDADAGKKRTSVWWAIAAGFVGLVLIGTLLFKGDGDTKQPELVQQEVPKEIIESEKKEVSPKTQVALETLEELEKTPQENVLVDQTSENNSTKNTTVAVNQTLEKSEEKLIENTPIATPIKIEVADIDPVSNKTELENKVDQVVNQILDLQAQNSNVSEAEVAALLDAAQKDLEAKSLINPLTQKVDAMALLDQVEFDLERSFRDKVFNALGDGFNKIRTAMAERNN